MLTQECIQRAKGFAQKILLMGREKTRPLNAVSKQQTRPVNMSLLLALEVHEVSHYAFESIICRTDRRDSTTLSSRNMHNIITSFANCGVTEYTKSCPACISPLADPMFTETYSSFGLTIARYLVRNSEIPKPSSRISTWPGATCLFDSTMMLSTCSWSRSMAVVQTQGA